MRRPFGFALLLLLLSSCASVEIENHEWCVIAGDEGAYCFHTLSEDQRDLSKLEWEVLSTGWLAGSPEAFANMKATIEKLCEETKRCTYAAKKKIAAFFQTLKEKQMQVGIPCEKN